MPIYPVASLSAVGPENAARLKAAGIRSTAALLRRAGAPRGRRRLAEACGVEEALVLRWANLADLMRVRGVAAEYAELLEAAGVETVRELKRRNAANLSARLAAVNAEQRFVRLLPSERRITGWIAHAGSLPPAITYRSDHS